MVNWQVIFSAYNRGKSESRPVSEKSNDSSLGWFWQLGKAFACTHGLISDALQAPRKPQSARQSKWFDEDEMRWDREFSYVTLTHKEPIENTRESSIISHCVPLINKILEIASPSHPPNLIGMPSWCSTLPRNVGDVCLIPSLPRFFHLGENKTTSSDWLRRPLLFGRRQWS